MQRTPGLTKRGLIVLLGLWLLLAATLASAQLTENIAIGETVRGEISRDQPYARYAVAINGTETLDIRIRAAASGLAPWFRVLDSSSTAIARIHNDDRVATLSAVVPLPEAGLYIIEIGGEANTTGAFSIRVGLGPSVPGATVLRAGETAEGAVSAEVSEQVYDVNSSVEGELLVMVRGLSRDAGPEVEMRNEIVDQTVGTGGTLLSGVAFLIQPGDSSYSLRVRFAGSAASEPYRVCVARVQAADHCLRMMGVGEPE